MDAIFPLNMSNNIFETTTAITAIYLWIIFNFLGTMLNCDLQRAMKNPVLHHIMGLIVFFFLFTIADQENNTHVAVIFIKTMFVYVLFVLATKSKWYFVVMSLLLLFVDQVLKKQVAYLEANKKPYDANAYARVRKALTFAVIAFIVIGCIHYFVKQKMDHGSKFRFITFLTGTGKCKD